MSWTENTILINGEIDYSLSKGEINQNYVDIEIIGYSKKWDSFDASIEYKRYSGDQWHKNMEIIFSTANTIDKNRLRDLTCSENGGLNLVRWNYRKNGLRYGQNPDVRIRVLPKFINFSKSPLSYIISKNSGINNSEFIGFSQQNMPINLNKNGQIIALSNSEIKIYDQINGTPEYTYGGLSNPKFALQINNKNYIIADTNNNRVLELDETFSTVINSISISEPIFIDFNEINNSKIVTTLSGVIYEYSENNTTPVWTSSLLFNNLYSATYSKKDFNRIVASDIGDEKVTIIDRNLSKTYTYYGFENNREQKDNFIKPHIAVEFEDGNIAIVEKNGRIADFEEFQSSSSSSIDSSSSSSLTSSSLSSSSSSSN
jgi:hypothetical protein